MKKILFALFMLSALSCVKEQPMNNPQDMAADVRQVVLCASNEAQTKTYFNKDNGTITWNTTEDPLAIFDGGLQKFTCSEVSEDQTFAYFTGSADVAKTSWIAVHPYSHTSVVNSELVVKIPSFQTARAKGGIQQGENTSAAIVSVVNGEPQGFTMMNVGGLLKFTVAETGIKTITFSTIGGEPLTGNVKLSFEDGKPKTTVLDGETFVTLKAADMTIGFAPGDYFACVLPVNLSQGIRIDMEKTDGKTASVAAKTPAEVLRSGDLEFAGVDTGASWYMPELSTIELDFPNGSWPFNEATNGGGTAAESIAWASDGEKVMTLKENSSILFYMHCSNYCSATGSNGLRFGKAAGDYMLFPAIPGKSLKKVAVTFLTDDNMKAAIRTRSGCSDVLGGEAVGKQAAGTTYEYNLVGTARNMQYRYELTGANDVTHISKIVLTYASKGTPAGEEPEVPALVVTADFVDADDKSIEPFTEKVDLNKITVTDKDYTLAESGYVFTINGSIRINPWSSKYKGIRLESSGDYIKLPAIEGYRLSSVDAVVGGVSDTNDGPVPAKTVYISSSGSSADAIATATFAECTIPVPSSVSMTLSDTSENTPYYLVMGSNAISFRKISLNYIPVDSSSSVAPAQLSIGDQAEI